MLSFLEMGDLQNTKLVDCAVQKACEETTFVVLYDPDSSLVGKDLRRIEHQGFYSVEYGKNC